MASKYKKLFNGLLIGGSLFGGYVILKDFIGPKYPGKEEIEDKTVIITGATSGIGKELAMDLAKRGARVILASRDMKKCAEVRKDIISTTFNKRISCRECNLASQNSIREFVQVINSSEPRVNILVNNAGVMSMKRSVTREGIELNLGVNYLGHFLLTLLLLDKIKASAPSRIINVTNAAYSKGQINFDDLNSSEKFDDQTAHLQSKLAVVLFTKELAERLSESQVTCNVVNPGLTHTNLTREMSFSKSYLTSIFLKPFLKLFLKSPKQGAQNSIYAAVDSAFDKVSGSYISNLSHAEISGVADNTDITRRLWAVSERWTSDP